MRFVRVRRWPNVPGWIVLIVLLWLALVGTVELVAYFAPADTPTPTCLVRRATGVPCPTCGSTRAVLAAASGRPLRAFALNPLMTILGIAAVVWAVSRLGFGRQLSLGHASTLRRALPWVFLALLLINWAYVIWHEHL